MQPPPSAPDWVRNAPDGWISRALRKDQQAAGLLPPSPLGGPILTGSRARQEAANLHWKRDMDELRENKRHGLQMVARQRLLDEQAVHQRQEAAHCQRLLDERHCLQTAARQCLLDEQAAL